MNGRIRVGLVGCGRIARVHRSYLRKLPQVELIGASDSDEGARAAFARDTQIPCFSSLDEMLERGRPEVVHVLTPPASHAPLAIDLLKAGVNVLVEKPFALNRTEADAMLGAAQRGGCWVTVDHNRWFDPVVQEAAQTLARGSLGRLVGVDVFQGAEAGEADKRRGPSAHWSARLPGGILHNLAPHPLYLMRRFAGAVRDLRVVARQGGEGRLEEVRLVALGEEAPASVTMSLRARPFMNRLVLFGTEATLEVNLNNMTLIERRPRSLPKLIGKVWPNVSEAGQLLRSTVRNGVGFVMGRQRFYPGIGAHLRTLYERVANGSLPPVAAEEGRDVVGWYDEILDQCGIATVPSRMVV